LRREFHGLGEIAAGVMQQAAKRSGFLIFRPVGGLNKGRALFFIEKEALSVSVEKVCSHLENLNEKQKIEKAPTGAFSEQMLKISFGCGRKERMSPAC
jgi:hypothetical protein